VPLESVLHAYRLGFRTIWEALVAEARRSGQGLDALVDAATQVWEVVDLFSAAVADAYRATEQSLARRDDRRREALLDALLEGGGRDPAVAAEAGLGLELPERGDYCVVVVDGHEHGADARRAVARAGLRSAWRTRAADEVGLVLLAGGPGRDHVPADVVAALDAVSGLRAGASPAVVGLSSVDTAHRAARTALRALPAHEHGVSELDARLPAALVVTAPELGARLVRHALGGVLDLPGEERDLLLDTLRTWLDTDGSAGRTAARLYCHRNTVLNRLRRLEAVTGRSGGARRAPGRVVAGPAGPGPAAGSGHGRRRPPVALTWP
jgi:sugar diacid utilization regulator